MALRHLLLRLTPRLDRRWLIGAAVVLALAGAISFIRLGDPAPPLSLLALGPEGTFEDTVRIPADWGDTLTATPGATVRVPLILGVRNLGTRAVAPETLALSLPARFRLTDEAGRELQPVEAGGTPLTTYAMATGLQAVPPERLPVLLPAHDTLWLEVVLPSFYCVAVADSIPEFVPAPPPPVETVRNVRMFYAFQGGDLEERRTGTLAVLLDSALLDVAAPADPPTFPMEVDAASAQPAMASLQRAGSRRVDCGEPGSQMELLSTVWETEDGGRFITLDYGGKVRKRLYDLDGDSIIERESWDPTGQNRFVATRRASFPIPAFLLPARRPPADTLAADTLPGDTLPGDTLPGDTLPGDTARAGAPPDTLPGATAAPDTADAETTAPETPAPAAEPPPEPGVDPIPLGQPIGEETTPPDTGGG